MKLSVIVPTLNRPSLGRALASCRGAYEVIVVGDGPEAQGARSVFEASGLPGRVVLPTRRYNDFGNTLRQIGLAYCSGDWIGYLDDDDAYLPEAMELFAAELLTPLPHFFRVEFADIGIVWRQPELRVGNITSIGILHPNDRRWGQWSHHYQGDYDFAVSTAANYPGVRWVDRIIAQVEGHSGGKG